MRREGEKWGGRRWSKLVGLRRPQLFRAARRQFSRSNSIASRGPLFPSRRRRWSKLVGLRWPQLFRARCVRVAIGAWLVFLRLIRGHPCGVHYIMCILHSMYCLCVIHNQIIRNRHVGLLHALSRRVEAEGVMEASELEQQLACVQDHRAALKQVYTYIHTYIHIRTYIHICIKL